MRNRAQPCCVAGPWPCVTVPIDPVNRSCNRVAGSVLNAWTEKVHSSRGLTQMLERGMARRATASNVNDFAQQNVNSSRSHAFLTLTIKRLQLAGQQVGYMTVT